MLKDTDAEALLRELRRRRLRVRTLVLSRHSSPLFVQDAFKAGAHGFALKRQGVEELRAAIRVVASGEPYRAPELDEAARNTDERAQRLTTLSAREREILSRVIEGRSNAEIAQALFISRRTVDSHRNRMNRKLGVSSPLELLRLAAESGLID
jgi:two-component system NarL family response regulator